MIGRALLCAVSALAIAGSAVAQTFPASPQSPIGAAGGSLSGTYPNPGLAAGAAIANLGFTPAHSGANSDLTSIAGLTTALSIGQGGTGLTTFAAHGLFLGEGASITILTPGTSGFVLTSNGASADPSYQAPAAGTTYAAPTGLTGLTAVTGVAPTAERSDATHAIDQSISPTWTGNHSFANAITLSSISGTQCLHSVAGVVSGAGADCGTATMVYPGAGIANSTGSAWGTSYTTTGSGTVVALATAPTFTGFTWTGTATGAGLNLSAAATGSTFSLTSQLSFSTGTGSVSWSGRGALSSPAAGDVQLGLADGASPVAQTLSAQSATGSNVAGANTVIQGSRGTGTGAGGSISVTTAPAGTTGSTQNAALNAMTVTAAQHVILGNSISNPPVAGTGTASIAAGATDQRFVLTTGSSVTAMSVSFGSTWMTSPVCVVTEEGSSPVALSISAKSTSGLTITAASALTSAVIDTVCD